jgi:hypothetical protein
VNYLYKEVNKVLGSEKSDGIPEHKSQKQVHESYGQETKNLRKLVLASKVVNPFTRSRPFYRETKGLLHSENTLKSREYS